jgi:hypothetical protein
MLTDYHKHLAGVVATRLSGHPVELRWDDPADARYHYGVARKAGTVGIIEIEPWHDQQKILDVLLHETAHLRQHWDSIPDDLVDPPEAQRRRPVLRGVSKVAQAFYHGREREADELAARWKAWAWEHSRDGTLEAQLEALAGIDTI